MKKRNETQKSVTRRDFLKRASTVTALAGATWFTAAQARAIIGANERIGVGFIGAGGRSVSHLSSIEALKNEGENVAIVAVADVYRPRAKARVEKYGGTLYADYRELIADPNVDMVAISTPDHHHAQQTIDAVRAKKAVYCEKPVSHWRQFELTKKMAEEVRHVRPSMAANAATYTGRADRKSHSCRMRLFPCGRLGRSRYAD